MKRTYTSLVLAALIGAAACDDPASSPVALLAHDAGPLELTAPLLDGFDPTVVEVGHEGGPVRGGPQAIDVEDVILDIPAQIINPRTTVTYDQTGVVGTGMHHYTSNVGSVTTTVRANWGGVSLGQQSATRTDNVNMFLHIGQTRFIYVGAKIYTDKPCGISASASSRHEAWYEAFLTGPEEFGKVVRSTRASADQPDCGQRQGTDGGGGSNGSQYTYCTYLITYDRDTGDIVDSQLLYCESGSDDTLI